MAAEEDIVVCPKCLGENDSLNRLCRWCGVPFRDCNTTNPMAPNYNGPTNPIVLVGMWLILGPTCFAALSILVFGIYGFATEPSHSSFGEIFGVAVVISVVAIVGLLAGIPLYRVTKSYFHYVNRRRAPSHGFDVVLRDQGATRDGPNSNNQ